MTRSLRICSRCGKPLEDATKHTALCPACRALTKGESVIRPRTCRACGGVFEGGPRSWYCPACRLERKREADRAQKRRGSARRLGSLQICEHCGGEYTLTGSRQRYCPSCAEDAIRETVAPHKREQARAYDHRHRRALMQGVRRCVVCGGEITADTPTNTCSPACREQQRKLSQRRAELKRRKNHPE